MRTLIVILTGCMLLMGSVELGAVCFSTPNIGWTSSPTPASPVYTLVGTQVHFAVSFNSPDYDTCIDDSHLVLDGPVTASWTHEGTSTWQLSGNEKSADATWSSAGEYHVTCTISDPGNVVKDPNVTQDWTVEVADWGPPPGPPADDYPGAPPGDENDIPPLPETITYDSTPYSGVLVCTEIDPDTGEPVDVSCANDEIVLSFVPDATLEQIDAALAAVGAWKKMNIQAAKLWSAGIQSAATCEELQAKIDQLKANPLVLDADVNVIGEPGETTPNDPLYPPPPGQDPNFNGQWNLRRSGVSVAWDTEQGKGDYSTIGVVDEGVETTHSDLRANLWDSQGPRGSHGTRVTGIAAAVTNNQNMLAGLGWNARAVVKTTDWGYMVTMDKLGNLINCSATRPGGIAAINISGIWCKPYYMWWSMESLMNAAVDRGILPVAAMGNDNKELRLYPAGFLRAMAVGATDHFLRDYLTGPEVRVSFPGWWGSNYGNHISVVAPGVDITTTDLHDSYLTHFAGTSAATPHVTGLADLVRSEFQSMGPLDIRHRIEDTASDNVAPNVPGQPDPIPGFDKYTGWGFIKADAAMTSTTASCTISGDRWHIAILPVWPEENPSYAQWQESTWPQRVLPAAPAGGTRLIARIKPYTNDYYTQDQYDTNGRPLLDPVTPYRAYWVKYKNCTGNIRIDAQGAQAGLKTGHRVEFRLWANSQNMVGNPFRSNIQWGDPNIAVRYGHSGTTKTLSQAINDGVISATAYYWNPGTASYVPVIANTGKVMLPYRGYWIRVRGVSFKVHMLAKP